MMIFRGAKKRLTAFLGGLAGAFAPPSLAGAFDAADWAPGGDAASCGALGVAAALGGLAVWQGLRLRRLDGRLKASQAQARHLATHDTLLGLPNRPHFRFALDEAFHGRTGAQGHGLLYVDLDRFKDVNDSHGHEVGDRLLIAFTRRIRALIGPDDVFARVGGDEFAILKHGVGDRDALMAFARQLLETLEAPFDLGSHCLQATASVGAAIGPDCAASRTEWAQRADYALYQAKMNGRGRAQMFEAAMLDNFRRRRIVKRDLAAAVANGRITAHYQPIFAADGARIVSAEALLRWSHPEFGPLPADFVVSVAEECGQILALGEFMLRRACLDAKRWNGPRAAVNVSALQFRSPGFVDRVAAILNETGFPAEKLELELTESIIVTEADLAEESMMRLRAMGVRMALDDFGAGYSSLMYLRRFPFDKIKIDRSFVETLEAEGESAVLLSTMIKLGHALGLSCTAEGVETQEQLWIAQNFGCEEIQGYLLSKPLTNSEFESMLGASRRVSVESLQRQAVA